MRKKPARSKSTDSFKLHLGSQGSVVPVKMPRPRRQVYRHDFVRNMLRTIDLPKKFELSDVCRVLLQLYGGQRIVQAAGNGSYSASSSGPAGFRRTNPYTVSGRQGFKRPRIQGPGENDLGEEDPDEEQENNAPSNKEPVTQGTDPPVNCPIFDKASREGKERHACKGLKFVSQKAAIDHAHVTHLSCPICYRKIDSDGDGQQPVDFGRVFFGDMKNLRFVKNQSSALKADRSQFPCSSTPHKGHPVPCGWLHQDQRSVERILAGKPLEITLRDVQPALYELYTKVRKSRTRQELEDCLYHHGQKVYDSETGTNNIALNDRLPPAQSVEANNAITAIQQFHSSEPVHGQFAPDLQAAMQGFSYPPAFDVNGMGPQFPMPVSMTSHLRGHDAYISHGPISMFVPVSGSGSMSSAIYPSPTEYGHPTLNPTGGSFSGVNYSPTTLRYSPLCDLVTDLSTLFNRAGRVERLALLKSQPEFFLAMRDFVNENEGVIESTGITVPQAAPHSVSNLTADRTYDESAWTSPVLQPFYRQDNINVQEQESL